MGCEAFDLSRHRSGVPTGPPLVYDRVERSRVQVARWCVKAERAGHVRLRCLRTLADIGDPSGSKK